MKQNHLLWQFAGFSLTSLGGTLLHFLYEWTNKSVLVAPFSGVNESTWEHMKLLYFPLFVFALIQSRFFKDYKNFWCIKLIGTSLGLVLIPVLFYTYNGAFGHSPDALNILLFFVSAAATFIIEACLFKKNTLKCKYPLVPFIIMCVIGIAFVFFTFITPQIPLFEDPLSGTFGI